MLTSIFFWSGFGFSFLWDIVSLYILGCPGTWYVGMTGPKFPEIFLLLLAQFKGMCHTLRTNAFALWTMNPKTERKGGREGSILTTSDVVKGIHILVKGTNQLKVLFAIPNTKTSRSSYPSALKYPAQKLEVKPSGKLHTEMKHHF